MKTLPFELKYLLKQKSTWVYFSVLFLLSFLVVNAAGGMFDSIGIQISGDQIHLNSPYLIAMLTSVFNMLTIIITAALFGQTMFRDYACQSNELVFSTGMSKIEYLLPRFLAPFLINGLLFCGVPLGMLVASYMPYLDQEMFGPFMFEAYWRPLLTIVYPNTIFVGAVFFLLTIWFKNITVNWVAIIGFYTLYGIGQKLGSDIDNETVAAMIEPFGIKAAAAGSIGMSTDDMNTETQPLEHLLLYNRILWTSIGLLLATIGYFKFSFSLKSRKGKKESTAAKPSMVLFKRLQIPVANLVFDGALWRNQVWFIAKLEFKKLIKSLYFKVILVLVIASVSVRATQLGKMYETTTYAVSYQVVGLLMSSTRMLISIMIILFSGEMVWNALKYKANELEDTLPISSGQRLLGQYISLAITSIVMVLALWGGGVVIQQFMGTTHEPLVFAGYLFPFLLHLLILAGLSFFVQSAVSNRYVGYFILAVWLLFGDYLGVFLQHNLLIFNGSPGLVYSDINGFGGGLMPVILFKGYWAAFIAILLYVAAYLYPRGTNLKFGHRWQTFLSFGPMYHLRKLTASLVLFAGFGAVIFYNTNILNEFEFSGSSVEKQKTYEKRYKHYEVMAQPKVVEIDVKSDLYPGEQRLSLDATYWFKNKSKTRIDTLLLSFDDKTTSVNDYDRLSLHEHDEFSGLHIYSVDAGLFPGDSIPLDFNVSIVKEGFGNSFNPGTVRSNGTFIWNSILPSLGYNEAVEINRNRQRKKYDLDEKPMENHRHHPIGTKTNGVSPSSDQVRFKALLSTSVDQIAFTSGNLINEWKEGERNFYQYELKGEMTDIYSIVSARYKTYSTTWHAAKGDTIHPPVDISINYHPTHEYNVELMADAVKASLDYYTENFGPYQHDLVRIMEFPRYASMAVSFPNTIPFSESIGFLADVRSADDETINYPYWVTAHEVAHQWWAHQLIPANVEGAALLTESFAQYSSVRVLEKKYGQKTVAKFLKNELQTYLMRRSNGDESERPLEKVHGHQQHVFYNKGAVVMYGLSEYLGEAKFNRFMASYLEEAKSGVDYKTTLSYMSGLREITPDSMQYIVDDWLAEITLYELNPISAKYTRSKRLIYTTTIDLEVYKYQRNAEGEEVKIPVNDWVEIGLYNKKEEEVYRELVFVSEGQQTIEIITKRKPSRVVLDPRNMLINKNWANSKTVDVHKCEDCG